MQVTITNKDVANLKKFMILHSKKAVRQKLISFYAVPFEFILVGIILDGFLKTVPLLSLVSLVMAVFWLIIYPMYYKNMCKKHIKLAEEMQESRVEMNFLVDDEKNIISFSPSQTPRASEKFSASSLNRIVKSEQDYFLGFKEGHHIVLPVTDESKKVVEKLSEDKQIHIECFEF
ncbi:hypothetical protein [Campylobacter geochelonis]|uniref:30S ribosomal protein S20 n=1 Tax=Campylobacter geochelonis TaxID=1780362 RepID=A0A128ELB7_9BACT|nr:hypothetical protein [Campylobacter geochelonis]QKF71953.1 putative membrane protein [Campylobacter geochelonis]CZE47201.1 30S ribosomal protein S20 [Campylobacter geochelonis]CZE47812.1 30S ribosomal protein S20 [Campylobacter geochelonis]CZE49967.1 30S ribosomal protein S20 [Campylobacter geochelonis]